MALQRSNGYNFTALTTTPALALIADKISRGVWLHGSSDNGSMILGALIGPEDIVPVVAGDITPANADFEIGVGDSVMIPPTVTENKTLYLCAKAGTVAGNARGIK